MFLDLDENIASNWDLYLITIVTLLVGMLIYLRRPPVPNAEQPPQQPPAAANNEAPAAAATAAAPATAATAAAPAGATAVAQPAAVREHAPLLDDVQ